jgi:hypothetical protein
VDNAVENDLKSAPIRSAHYPEVILVKKPSKKTFPLPYQFPARLYDEIARKSNHNISVRQGLVPKLGIGLCTARRS